MCSDQFSQSRRFRQFTRFTRFWFEKFGLDYSCVEQAKTVVCGVKQPHLCCRLFACTQHKLVCIAVLPGTGVDEPAGELGQQNSLLAYLHRPSVCIVVFAPHPQHVFATSADRMSRLCLHDLHGGCVVDGAHVDTFIVVCQQHLCQNTKMLSANPESMRALFKHMLDCYASWLACVLC